MLPGIGLVRIRTWDRYQRVYISEAGDMPFDGKRVIFECFFGAAFTQSWRNA